jgi:hypothetical protein
MDKIKNYAIAILTGLLVLSLFTQPAQSAGKSIQAKQVEYQACLNTWLDQAVVENKSELLNYWIKACARYRP